MLNTKDIQSPENKKIITPRNTWIKNILFTLAGFLVFTTAVDKASFMTVGSHSLNQGIVRTALTVSEIAPNSENPDYRPFLDILKEGISIYSEQSDQSLFFQRIDDYENEYYYANIIREHSLSSPFPQLPNTYVTDIVQNLPEGAFEAYFQSQSVMRDFDHLFTKGSGFDKRFRTRHPELVHASGLYIDTPESSLLSIMLSEGKLEINELKTKIEKQSQKTKQPVSASFILAHFLDKNEGDIALSIFDTAIFLKFMARNDPETGIFAPGEYNVNWYNSYIKDEYQGPLFASPPEGETALNLIGKPYHSWNLVAMLHFVPIEIIRIGGIQKQLSTFSAQGLSKTRADLQTLNSLEEIEQYLLTYLDTTFALGGT